MLAGRIVHPGDPLWTQDDTDLAVALTDLESGRCSGCGHPRTETMSPESEFGWRAEALRCHSCATRERAARAAAANDTWDESGVSWITTRKDDGG